MGGVVIKYRIHHHARILMYAPGPSQCPARTRGPGPAGVSAGRTRRRASRSRSRTAFAACILDLEQWQQLEEHNSE
eukprot:750076-Hanusia_phi.AAC.1